MPHDLRAKLYSSRTNSVLLKVVEEEKTTFGCVVSSTLHLLINNVLSNGNHTNDNNTTAHSSFLSATTVAVAVAVAVALPWVRHAYCIRYLIGRHGNNYKSPYSPSLCVPV